MEYRRGNTASFWGTGCYRYPKGWQQNHLITGPPIEDLQRVFDVRCHPLVSIRPIRN